MLNSCLHIVLVSGQMVHKIPANMDEILFEQILGFEIKHIISAWLNWEYICSV